MKYRLIDQLFGGRGGGSGTTGHTDSDGFFHTLEGVDNYSKQSLLSAANKATFTEVGDDEWRIAVSAGPEQTTAYNYGIASSVSVYGPDSPFNTLKNSEEGKYRVSGDYYNESFDSLSAAKKAARGQLKTQLGKTYDLRTKNRSMRNAK